MDKQKSYLGTEELPATTPTSDEKTLAILAHILTLAAWFIAPLVIYLIIKANDGKLYRYPVNWRLIK